MTKQDDFPRNLTDRLLESELAAYADAFKHHLTERRYASSSVDVYEACMANLHFG